MRLTSQEELLRSDVVANRAMNRTRPLRGRDSYETALALDIIGLKPKTWLDLCCGSGTALHEAAIMLPDSRITGVDLAGHFITRPAANLTLIETPLETWQPRSKYDLITCVHGLHYLGDKLGTISRVAQWLKPEGLLVANFEAAAIRDHDGNPVNLTPALKAAGFSHNAKTKRIRKQGPETTPFPWKYLGADKNAGPNYTGQPAVHSYYQAHG